MWRARGLRTTAERSSYVLERGWNPAKMLAVCEVLLDTRRAACAGGGCGGRRGTSNHDSRDTPYSSDISHSLAANSHQGGNEDKVHWLPLIQLARSSFSVGVDEFGAWVGEAADGLIRFTSNRSCTFLLPLLEKSRETSYRQILDALDMTGLPRELAEIFPFELVIQQGLQSSGYWVDLALGWIDSSPATDSLCQIALVAQASSNHQLSQQTRHRAQRILAKLKRSSTGSFGT